MMMLRLRVWGCRARREDEALMGALDWFSLGVAMALRVASGCWNRHLVSLPYDFEQGEWSYAL